MLHLSSPASGGAASHDGLWREREARRGEDVRAERGGDPRLLAALDAHRQRLGADWEATREARLRRRVRRLVEGRWRETFWTDARRQRLAEAVRALDGAERAPHALAERVLASGG